MLKGMLLASLTILVGCTSVGRQESAGKNRTGMANPAAVYCQEQGGQSVRRQGEGGERADCLLPGGERIDEWTLFRRDRG